MDEPPLLLQHPIDRFAIDHNLVQQPQHHPESSIAERGMLLNHLAEPLCSWRIGRLGYPLRQVAPMLTA
ncbi:MAG: hypothetical protein OJF51_000285 [Nitrospira sp.]|nr:MAG: hypothetical protein OJF51_000285 [Nitrospira sp.]